MGVSEREEMSLYDKESEEGVKFEFFGVGARERDETGHSGYCGTH
jgi:hypothetical protein